MGKELILNLPSITEAKLAMSVKIQPSCVCGQIALYVLLSHDVASESDLTLCNKSDKSLVVYRFSGNVMTCIIILRKRWQNLDFFTPKM